MPPRSLGTISLLAGGLALARCGTRPVMLSKLVRCPLLLSVCGLGALTPARFSSRAGQRQTSANDVVEIATSRPLYDNWACDRLITAPNLNVLRSSSSSHDTARRLPFSRLRFSPKARALSPGKGHMRMGGVGWDWGWRWVHVRWRWFELLTLWAASGFKRGG